MPATAQYESELIRERRLARCVRPVEADPQGMRTPESLDQPGQMLDELDSCLRAATEGVGLPRAKGLS